MPESCRVGGVGAVERDGPVGVDLDRGAVVHRRRGVQPNAGVAVDVVVAIEERHAERVGILDRAEPAGNAGQYLRVLKLASENGLSLLT